MILVYSKQTRYSHAQDVYRTILGQMKMAKTILSSQVLEPTEEPACSTLSCCVVTQSLSVEWQSFCHLPSILGDL